MAIDLTEDVKSCDEADKAKAHHENHRRRNLQARRVVGVEPEHVASTAPTAEPAGAPRSKAAATHARGGCRRAARRHADGRRTGGDRR